MQLAVSLLFTTGLSIRSAHGVQASANSLWTLLPALLSLVRVEHRDPVNGQPCVSLTLPSQLGTSQAIQDLLPSSPFT